MGIIDDLMEFAFGPSQAQAAPALPASPPVPGAVPLRALTNGGYVSNFGDAPPDAWGDAQGVPMRQAPGGAWVSAPWMVPDEQKPQAAAPAPVTAEMPARRPNTGGLPFFQTTTEAVSPDILAALDSAAGFPSSPPATPWAATTQALPAGAGPSAPALGPAPNSEVDFVDVLRGFSSGYREGGLLGAVTNVIGGTAKDKKRENMTVQALAARGLDPALASEIARHPDTLKALLVAQAKAKLGGTKWGVNPVEFIDAQGMAHSFLVSDDGQVQNVGDLPGMEGMTRLKPQVIDLGDRKEVVNKVGGQTTATRKVESYQPSYDKEAGQQEAKMDAEEPAKRSKAIGAYQSLQRKSRIVTEDIDRAISNITTGIVPRTGMWSKFKDTPSTPQHDLNELLKGVVANLGFDELQQMRDNSPTGGALGSITEKEIAFLQALRGSLEQSQTEDQLLFNLQRARRDYAEILRDREGAFARDFGGSPAAPSPTTPGQTGAGSYKVLKVR